MTLAAATRHVSKARTEAGYDPRPAARRAYTRATRRAAAAEIAEALAELDDPAA